MKSPEKPNLFLYPLNSPGGIVYSAILGRFISLPSIFLPSLLVARSEEEVYPLEIDYIIEGEFIKVNPSSFGIKGLITRALNLDLFIY